MKKFESKFSIEQLPSGVLVYRIKDSSRGTVDEWVKALVENEAYANDNHYHLRIMYLTSNFHPTPYGMSRMRSVMEGLNPEMRQSIAFVVMSNVIRTVLGIMTERVSTLTNTMMKSFPNTTNALYWLEQRKEILLRDYEFQPLPCLPDQFEQVSDITFLN
jgi:hypothetical protein